MIAPTKVVFLGVPSFDPYPNDLAKYYGVIPVASTLDSHCFDPGVSKISILFHRQVGCECVYPAMTP